MSLCVSMTMYLEHLRPLAYAIYRGARPDGRASWMGSTMSAAAFACLAPGAGGASAYTLRSVVLRVAGL